MKVPIEIVEGELGSAKFRCACEYDSHTDHVQIDTGSTYTAMRFDTSTSKYVAVGSKTRVSASGKPRTSEMIEIASFKIGSTERRNFQVVRYDPESDEAARVGMDWFNFKTLTFDLASETPSFMADAPVLTGNELHSLTGGTFGIDVGVGGKVCQALWDTGAELSVVDRDFAKAHSVFFEFKQKIDNGKDAAGNHVEFDLYNVNRLEIGSFHLSGAIMTMDFKMIADKIGEKIKIILGTNMMRGHTWKFDFARRRWNVS